MFDDDFMNDILLNPDLYGLEDDEEENLNKKDDFADEDDEED